MYQFIWIPKTNKDDLRCGVEEWSPQRLTGRIFLGVLKIFCVFNRGVDYINKYTHKYSPSHRNAPYRIHVTSQLKGFQKSCLLKHTYLFIYYFSKRTIFSTFLTTFKYYQVPLVDKNWSHTNKRIREFISQDSGPTKQGTV